MHGAYIGGCSENNIKCVVHDDLGPRSLCTTHLMLFSERKNRRTRYNCRFSAASLALRAIFVCRKRPPIYASCMTISGGRTEQHIIGFGELTAVDSFSILTE